MPKKYMLAIAGVAIVATFYMARRSLMLDPLKESGLREDEIRLFRYILSLHEYSGVNIYDVANDAESVRAFNLSCSARECRVCGRVYADLDQSCPYFHGPTVLLTKEELLQTVNKWEGFRRDYCQRLNLRTLTRLWAIKLYWLTQHPLEH